MRIIEDDHDDNQCERQCQSIEIPTWYFQALIDTLRDLVEENKRLKHHLNPKPEDE